MVLPPDVLKRQQYVEMVRQVIENKIDNKAGYSLAVDGQWGSGKTYVLQMLEEQLETRALVFHYNAWERDYYDEPLMALVSVFLEQMKENRILPEKDDQKEFTDNLIEIIGLMGDLTGLRQIKGAAKILKFVKKHERQFLSPKEIDTCLPLTAAVGKLHSALADLSEKRPVVLIVDELDRCLPEYAVKVLERLHHIVGETQIILITAVDASRLAHSIYNVFYGTSAKEEKEEVVRSFFDKYMTKFVDIHIPLPVGKPDADAENLLMGLEKGYEEWLFCSYTVFDKSFLLDCVSQIMEEIPRRDQEKIFKQVKLCHELAVNWSAKCAPRLQGVQLDSFHYGVLVYEILTVVSIYYLKNKKRFGIAPSVPVQIRLDVSDKTPIERKIGQIFRLDNCFTQDSTQTAWKLLADMGKPVSVILAYFLEAEKVEYIDSFYASSFSERIRQTTLFLRVFESVMKILSGDENESDFMYDLKEECEHSTGHLPKTSDTVPKT